MRKLRKYYTNYCPHLKREHTIACNLIDISTYGQFNTYITGLFECDYFDECTYEGKCPLIEQVEKLFE